jgi:hypothetical protein
MILLKTRIIQFLKLCEILISFNNKLLDLRHFETPSQNSFSKVLSNNSVTSTINHFCLRKVCFHPFSAHMTVYYCYLVRTFQLLKHTTISAAWSSQLLLMLQRVSSLSIFSMAHYRVRNSPLLQDPFLWCLPIHGFLSKVLSPLWLFRLKLWIDFLPGHAVA